MRIALVGSGAESLYPSTGESLAIQTVGLGEALASDHQVHVITRAERARHGRLRSAWRGATETINRVTYHALPAAAEVHRAVTTAGSLRVAIGRPGWLSGMLRRAIERLRSVRPEAIVVWNAAPFLEPLRRAFPSAVLCLFETRGWLLDVAPEQAGAYLEPASRILVPSACLAAAIRRHVPEVADALESVPLGVDTDLHRILVPRGKLPRRRDLIGGAGTILVTIGPLSPERGLEEILHRHDSLRSAIDKPHLFALGAAESDPAPPGAPDPFADRRVGHAARLQALAEEIGPWVHLSGQAVAPQEVAHIMGGASLLLAPRLDQPPTAQPLLEAMAAGVPVVASRAGAHEEVATSDDIGKLIEPGAGDAFVEACGEIAARDPQETYERGQRARQVVLANHTFEGMAARLLAIFQELRG